MNGPPGRARLLISSVGAYWPVLLGLYFLSAAASGQEPDPTACANSPQELAANKQLLLDFFASGHMPRAARAERFLTEDYIQHNPRLLRMDEVTGATGRQAWVAAFEEAQQRDVSLVDLGGISLTQAPVILMAECDLVTAIYAGDIADPDDPSRTYKAFAFETVRIRDGKFAEHWDQVQLEPGWMDTETTSESE